MRYQRRAVGVYAKKGVDIKHGDLVTIADAGQTVDGNYGKPQEVFAIRLVNGEEKSIALNQTSINNMIDAFGEISENWVGKEVKIWLFDQIVQNKAALVLYVSSPNAIYHEEDGSFELIDASNTVFNDPAAPGPSEMTPKEGEIKVEDIPF